MARTLVIVESPAKAKTIRGFLGSNYIVEASVGHVRDLPRSAAEIPKEVRGEPWARLGVNTENDFAPVYVVPEEKREAVARLKASLKEASELLLATDEDREGESISWHLREVLKPKVPVKRLVFHEITPEAIREALAHTRDIDEDLVRAQEARRIVDRLYGYEVSPLLWKKVRPKLSAGRVQSVAVRLIVDRERARIAFHNATWWDLAGDFTSPKGPLSATLAEWKERRLATGKDFDETTGLLKSKSALLLDEAGARALVARLQGRSGTVSKVESRPYHDRPAPPFTTSTLQQEANRKLRWTARHTMKVAQTLYESGWITYMRTDSVALSDQAVTAARAAITQLYGADHLPPAPRRYKSTAKNAQEAHEAIRPAGATYRSLDEARRELDGDFARLYELIWKRTVACQMADAEGRLLSMAVDVVDGGDTARFTAAGKTITFPGFRRAYVEGSDDPDAELADQERLLPPFEVGDRLQIAKLNAISHTTQPPARLTEATLVKELEARGIGRPSTYAEIIGKIIERDYVFKRGNALVPTFTAFAVTGLLERHLGELVDYAFTARIEDELDQVALGKRPWTETLRKFYLGGDGLRDRLGQAQEQIDPRQVCTVPIGRDGDVDIVVRIGRFGPFLSANERTADVPEDTAPEDVTVAWALARLDGKAQGPRVLGQDAAGLSVFLCDGRFGPYVQRGEATAGEKPPRASLLPGMKPENIDLDTALGLLSLPRVVGVSGTGDEITASNGRFGPYVRRGKETRTIPGALSALTITVAEAEVLFAQPARRSRTAIEPLRTLGPDPVSGGEMQVMKGRFGPYVTDGTTNATLPKGVAPEEFSAAMAAELLEKRRAAGPPVKRGAVKRGGARAASPRAATSKAATSKAATPNAAAPKTSRTAPIAAASKTTASKAMASRTAASTAATASRTAPPKAAAPPEAASTPAANPSPSPAASKAPPTPKASVGARAPATKPTAKATGSKGTAKKKPAPPPPKPVIPQVTTVKYRPTTPTPEPTKATKAVAPYHRRDPR